MLYFNEGFYNKSYILEFYKNNNLQDAFAFSLPPQSEEVELNQRINQIKTFGGIIYDDYGNDSYKITLKGTTANKSLRAIIRKHNSKEYVYGDEEIEILNDLIKDYGKNKNLKGKTVYLYSLNEDDHFQRWQVLIESFEYQRSKNNPLCYEYTIQFTGVVNTKINKHQKNKVKEFRRKVLAFNSKLADYAECLEKGLQWYKEGLEYLAALNDAANQMVDVAERYENAVTGYIDATASYVKSTKQLGDTVLSAAARIVGGAVDNVLISAKNLVTATKDMVVWVRNIDDLSDNLNKKYNTAFYETIDDIKDTWNSMFYELENDAEQIEAEAEKTANNGTTASNPGDSQSDDEQKTATPAQQYSVTDGDTWDSLALRFLGDASYGAMLAVYNGKSEITAGETVVIPTFSASNNNENNQIYNPYGKVDNMGADIKLSDSGDFNIGINDFTCTENQNTLAQAIKLRLSSEIGSRCRLVVYGIKSNIGDSNMATAYVKSSIKETLEEDPRISTVDSISFSGVGDDLNVKVVYTDINNDTKSLSGVF